ncbi:hypothetical protein [uncultured Thiodictyon sp.]|jgi:hypothetical protein|uniref:hypothetical protein n=1 Tax=uncultured Thiodictyon sp. TaxID=1846217 RepID=UPI0025D65268|nr:hypothetical protein [uncultured Thiodictyon sp.]
MNHEHPEMISIIGSAYCQPIADLLEKLLKKERVEDSRLHSGYHESGYAASVILLLVAMLESYVARLHYCNREQITAPSEDKLSAVEVIRYVFPDSTALEELAEVYIVRDALIHSHLWELNVREATRNIRCGDKKFKKRVDEKTRRTKNLGLNVVPTSIDREDALKVFNAIWTALLDFKGKDSSTLASSDHPIRFNGEQMPFSKLRDEIEKSRSRGREKEGTPF